KAGGPHYLFGLGEWTRERATSTDRLDPRAERLLRAARDAHLPAADVELLSRAFGSDAGAWRDEFGTARDVSALQVERNVLRYAPTPVHVRFADDASLADGLRVLGAGLLVGGTLDVSSAFAVPDAVRTALQGCGVAFCVEDEPA